MTFPTDNSKATCEYGDLSDVWADAFHSNTLVDYVAGALGVLAADADVEAIADAYRDAINAQLEPLDVQLRGYVVYGPYTDRPENRHIVAAIEAADFWAVVHPHLP